MDLVRFEVEKIEMLGWSTCFYISEHSNKVYNKSSSVINHGPNDV